LKIGQKSIALPPIIEEIPMIQHQSPSNPQISCDAFGFSCGPVCLPTPRLHGVQTVSM
jgi:hypothetical protein